jgi:hypothetical protein
VFRKFGGQIFLFMIFKLGGWERTSKHNTLLVGVGAWGRWLQWRPLLPSHIAEQTDTLSNPNHMMS